MLKNITFFSSAVAIPALVLAACGDGGEGVEMRELSAAQEEQERNVIETAPGQDTVRPGDELNTLPDPGDPPPMRQPGDPDMEAPPPVMQPEERDAAFAPPAVDGEPRARADFEFASMQGAAATAWFFEAEEGVQVYVRARGMTPGAHAIHVHETGDCSAADFTSAGPHLGENAGEVLDGKPEDFEAGVLPDIEIGGDGEGVLLQVLDTVVFENADDAHWPLLDADGTAIVIHEFATPDAPADGNPRIACGEIYASDF